MKEGILFVGHTYVVLFGSTGESRGAMKQSNLEIQKTQVCSFSDQLSNVLVIGVGANPAAGRFYS